jgi:hypothetical protein
LRETGIGTSLILIATGAILAFAVNIQSPSIDIGAIGVILMLVGLLGLVLSFVFLGSLWSGSPSRSVPSDTAATPPHQHRRVEETDIVYEDEDRGSARVERVRRVRR